MDSLRSAKKRKFTKLFTMNNRKKSEKLKGSYTNGKFQVEKIKMKILKFMKITLYLILQNLKITAFFKIAKM